MSDFFKKLRPIFLILFFLVFISVLAVLVEGGNVQLLNPRGWIGLQEKKLILIVASILVFVVVIPVFIFVGLTVWKYRADNHAAEYAPDTHSFKIEFLWWAFPAVIISIIAVLTWTSAHALDPFKPIQSDVKPMTVQVVALDWKWLFIYPEQGIATVNFLEIPENTPIHFELTADGPMNSFWIPQLGGQIYAMSGMSTQLHLIADATGDFSGSAAEVNGRGFSGMKFITRSVTNADFDQWVLSTRHATTTLTHETYDVLAKPSEDNPVVLYSSVDENTYNTIMQKFMTPTTQIHMQGMNMGAMNNQ